MWKDEVIYNRWSQHFKDMLTVHDTPDEPYNTTQEEAQNQIDIEPPQMTIKAT